MPSGFRLLKVAAIAALSAWCGILLFELGGSFSTESTRPFESISLVVSGSAALVLGFGFLLALYRRRRDATEIYLRESENNFRAICEGVSDAIVAADADFNIVFWNSAAESVFGYTADEVTGKPLAMVLPEEKRERYLARIDDLVHTSDSRRVFTAHLTGVRKGGALFSMEVALSMGRHRTGIVLTGVVRDVSDRRRAANAIRQQAATMRAITEGTVDAVWVKSLDGRYTLVNSMAARVFGCARSEIIGHTDAEIFSLQVAAEIEGRDRLAIDSGEPVTAETSHPDSDGATRYYTTTRSPWRDAEGKIIGLIGVIRDVTSRVQAENTLRQSEERYRLLVENSPEAIVLHREGTLRYINRTGARLLGDGDPASIIDKPLTSFVHPASHARLGLALKARERGEFDAVPNEYKIISNDGTVIDVEALSVQAQFGGEAAIQTVLRDVTERRKAEWALRDREARLRLVMQQIPAVLWATDRDGRITSALGSVLNALGLEGSALVSSHVRDLFMEDDRDLGPVRATGSALIGQSAAFEFEWMGRSFACSVEPLRAQSGRIDGTLGLAVDITERKQLETQLTYRAFHDSLTGLANRALFRDRVTHALSRLVRGDHVAVVFLDLDDFKTINDSLGHTEGDHLLEAVAARLLGSVRSHDTVARFGGDEFAILLQRLESAQEALDVVRRVEEALCTPIDLLGREVVVSCSIGLAHAALGDSADDILRNADVAMYRAKDGTNERHVVFEPRMHAAIVDRLELEGDLRLAVERGELFQVYQPVVDLNTGEIQGFEALTRWNHPTRGMLMPPEFIGIAEETGLIVDIGSWVVRTACAELGRWHALARSGVPSMSESLRMGINISGHQVQSERFGELVADSVRAARVPANRVVLEITEGTIMRRTADMLEKLYALKEIGVQLAIDDFGTGYSSLSYLQRFPIDVLKVDKTFIDGIVNGGSDAAIIRTILALGDMLKLRTLAEGVETNEQVVMLRALGCKFAQGYVFSQPLRASEVVRWATDHDARWRIEHGMPLPIAV